MDGDRSMLSYQDALTAWVARRESVPVVALSEVFIDKMDAGGPCGNDTCWFNGEVDVSFMFEDGPNREKRTYDVSPGDFISEIAAIARGE